MALQSCARQAAEKRGRCLWTGTKLSDGRERFWPAAGAGAVDGCRPGQQTHAHTEHAYVVLSLLHKTLRLLVNKLLDV
jgi:hypothetical protein